ncbi:hypothetical protein ADL00_37570 [Streptomyces sp. AS58]|uniref:hypothetical protein n=1 Tax=Streptomyces sp. AS58 TaxID=1519489 RepID=UPI0006AEFBBD|nr:hypothetical protein [Streptomyces sp. AS58]KOV52203.1 hypothetical protein ADL00_37570 [Streptomyces sp. AS58]
MNTLQKIGAFGAALAATFTAAYGIGYAVTPGGTDAGARDAAEAPAPHDAPPAAPGGLQLTERGYTLDLETTRMTAGERSELRFVVRDMTGRPVTGFRREHEKELHLVVASRDLTTYRHLHPTRAADGTWRTSAALPEPGGYRVFADFTPAAERTGLTLGADLAVAGRYRPDPLPAVSRTATVDGYSVELGGALRAGGTGELTFEVSRDGRPVALQPYLGARGHLVALRAGDLAFLHVHPYEKAHGTAPSGSEVAFSASAPSAGAYRLFLDFKVGGTVRTAAFTVDAGGRPPKPAHKTTPAPAPERDAHEDAHEDASHGH